MNNVETLMLMEVEDRLNEMSKLDPTDEGYKAREEATLKFVDRMAKLRELELEAEANKLKEEELKAANKLKTEEIEETKKKRHGEMIWTGVKTVGGIVVPVAMSILLTNLERTDVPISTATKEFWKKCLRIN